MPIENGLPKEQPELTEAEKAELEAKEEAEFREKEAIVNDNADALAKLKADSIDSPAQESKNNPDIPDRSSDDEDGMPDTRKLCPYLPAQLCDYVATTECDVRCRHNPENYMEPEVRERYAKEPWAVYCLTCSEFLMSRAEFGHENHVLATGYSQYKHAVAKAVMDRMTGGGTPSI